MIYCIGLPKSGTQSIANLFSKYNAKHEPRYNVLGYLLTQELIDNIVVKSYFWVYKNLSNLILESDHQLIFFIYCIISTDSKAKFIFTYRDFATWFVSLINQQYAAYKYENGPYGKLLNIERAKIGKDVYDCPDSILNKMRLPGPLSYKKYYEYYFHKVSNVQPERVLKLSVNQIENRVKDISAFVGVDYNQLNFEGIRSHQRSNKLFKLEDIIKEEDLWLFK